MTGFIAHLYKLLTTLHKPHYVFSNIFDCRLKRLPQFCLSELRLADCCQSVRLGDKPLETHDQQFFFLQLNTCDHSSHITSSLTIGWVYRLQLLLVLASAVILESESWGTHDHISLSQSRDSPNLEGQVPVFISPGTEWPSYTPGTGFPFRRLLRLAELRWRICVRSSLHSLGAAPTENTISTIFLLCVYRSIP
jgi:hypothetical protein